MQGAASPSAPGPTDLTQRCLVAERLATYTRKVTSTPPPGGGSPNLKTTPSLQRLQAVGNSLHELSLSLPVSLSLSLSLCLSGSLAPLRPCLKSIAHCTGGRSDPVRLRTIPPSYLRRALGT